MATEAQDYPQAESPAGSSMQRTDSALRSSIAKYGSNSYYYAHAPLPAASEVAKKIEGPGIVTGGPPALLASSAAEPERTLSAKEAAVEAVGGRKVSGGITLKKYTWCDSNKTVKLYVHLEAIRPGEECDGPLLRDQVAVEFGSDRVAIAIERASGLYLLAILRTYGTILPKDCSFSVTEKKVSVTLRKEEETLTWYNLTKD
ncbi:hypothetical protein Efla_005926 [Eimeria flavescens]